MNGLERKAARKFRAKCRRLAEKGGLKIDSVIRHSAASPIKPGQTDVDAQGLLDRATKDMGIRVKLTNAWHAGDTQAGKRRRQLNDWELATDPAGPVEAWQEDSKHRPKTGGRRATGKCDADAVTKLNKAKRGY